MSSEAHSPHDVWAEAESWIVHPRKGKAKGGYNCSPQMNQDQTLLGGARQKDELQWRQTSVRQILIRWTEQKFFPVREVKCWDRLARKTVGSPSLEIDSQNSVGHSSRQLHLTLKVHCWVVCCVEWEAEQDDLFKASFNLNFFYDCIYTNFLLKKQQLSTPWIFGPYVICNIYAYN